MRLHRKKLEKVSIILDYPNPDNPNSDLAKFNDIHSKHLLAHVR